MRRETMYDCCLKNILGQVVYVSLEYYLIYYAYNTLLFLPETYCNVRFTRHVNSNNSSCE